MKIFTGSSNQDLAKKIARYLNTRIGDSEMRHFS
ncbi:ribose-phosphate pyrophosphokinase-like domain-containing protein, partial [bacterium]|nr:ribose-phosphate pyrophosphokinase-like domain-containing protein [bacterium]